MNIVKRYGHSTVSLGNVLGELRVKKCAVKDGAVEVLSDDAYTCKSWLIIIDKARNSRYVKVDENFHWLFMQLETEEFLLFEDTYEEAVELREFVFLYRSKRDPEQIVFSSEPPDYVEDDDCHFLTKFGVPASTVPEVHMTYAQYLTEVVAAAQASLKNPDTDLLSTVKEYGEELRDRHVVIDDDLEELIGPDGFPDMEQIEAKAAERIEDWRKLLKTCGDLVIGEEFKRRKEAVKASASGTQEEAIESGALEAQED